MQSYHYKAINEAGRTLRGTLTAENELDLEARLKQTGMDLISCRPARNKTFSLFGKVRYKDLIVLCMHMEQLDRAGVPLHEALGDVRDTTESAKLRDVLTSVYESVSTGKMLSAALAEHPRVFNNVFVGLIATGEKTGHMASAFHHLAEHLKWTGDIQRKVKKAVRYPIGLFFVLMGVIGFQMAVVVPKMIEFLLNQDFEIPIYTRALIWTSQAFQNYWYLVIGVPILIAMIFIAIYRMDGKLAYKLDRIMLKAPMVGPVFRKIDLARFTHFFSVMFNSGIDILESLETARSVVRNRVLKEAIGEARSRVMEGNALYSSLSLTGRFPNLVVRIFKVGEDSGNMKDALENINFFYDREVNDAVDKMVGMIQPTLIVVMGLIIVWIIVAVFGPIYGSFSKMKF